MSIGDAMNPVPDGTWSGIADRIITASTLEPPPDGLPTPRRYWAATAIWLAMAVTVIDSSIANIALPVIARDFHASPQASVWVINAYQIAITMLLLPLAALGEVIGFRRTYGVGLLVFVGGSVACALAPGLTSLSITRFLQGAGAAGVMAINGAMIRFTYPKAMLGRGVGYNGMVIAIASAAGPGVAALILSVAGWRWLFAINLPIGILAFCLGQRCLPDTPGTKGNLDVVSSLLSAAMFGGGFLVATSLAVGATDWRTEASAVVAVLSGILLVRRAGGQRAPLVPLDLLRIPLLRLSYATSICTFAAQTAALVAVPFFLERRLGFDPRGTALLITLWPLGLGIAAPISGRAVETLSPAALGGIGLLLMAAGLTGIGLSGPGVSVLRLGTALAACGAGFGLFQAPNNRAMLGIAPLDRSGAAAGMLATARLIGQTTGAVLAAAAFRAVGPDGVAIFFLCVALAVAGAILSLCRLERRRPAATAS